MIAATLHCRDLIATDHLQTLRALTGELERAMQAIGHNDLLDLEESVGNQQILSARLAGSDDALRFRLNQVQTIFHFEEGLLQKIQAANCRLQKLNRRYAALIHLSSRSGALMASLFGSSEGQLQEISGPRFKHQTWSCRA